MVTFLEFIIEPIMNRINKMENKIMTALDDLTNAVLNLTTVEAKFLTDLANTLTAGSVSDADAEALAATINQRATDLINADPANGVPVPNPPAVGGGAVDPGAPVTG